MVGVLTTLSGLLVAAVMSPLGERAVDWVLPISKIGQLDVVDTVLENTNGDGPSGGLKHATLDIKVQNNGSARLVVKGVTFVLQNLLSVEVCTTEGELDTTGEYDVTLPAAMKPGDRVEHPLNQQLAADEADRFIVTLQQPPVPDVRTISFYRLKASLETSGNPSATELGDIVVALPFIPNNRLGGWYWSQSYASGESSLGFTGSSRAGIENCMKKNSVRIREFLAKPGACSTDLAAFVGDLR
jgi:hypothetical protein